jgi:hypothetical protein
MGSDMEDVSVGSHPVSAPIVGTEADAKYMRRMGRVQELNVSRLVERIVK